jgi:hypothetical protein
VPRVPESSLHRAAIVGTREAHDGRRSSSRWHLPRHALIEFAAPCRLGLGIEAALPGIRHLP